MKKNNFKKYLLIFFTLLVIFFFIGYNAIFLLEKNKKQAYGKTDFAVFYAIGSAISGKFDLEPTDIFNKKEYKRVIKELRPQEGGTRFLYPAQSALLFAPLTLIDFKLSYNLWAIMNGLIFIACYYLTIHYLIKDNIFRWRYSLILLSLSFADTVSGLFKTGQINGLVWFFMLGGIILVYKKRSWLAGIGYGLAITFKIFPLIFLPYFFIKRKFKVIISTLLTIFLILIISVPILGWNNILNSYTNIQKEVVSGQFTSLSSSTSLLGSFDKALKNGDFNFLSNSEIKLKKTENIADKVHTIITLIIIALLGIYFFVNRKKNKAKILLIDYTILISFILLFSKNIHKQFHFWILPFILFLFSFPIKKAYIKWHILGVITLALTQFYKFFVPEGFTFIGFKPATFGLLLILILALCINKVKFLKVKKIN